MKRLLIALLFLPVMAGAQSARFTWAQFDSTGKPAAFANALRLYTGKGDTLFAVLSNGDTVAVAPERASAGGGVADGQDADSIKGKRINSAPSVNGTVPTYYSTGDSIGWAAVSADSARAAFKADTLHGDIKGSQVNSAVDTSRSAGSVPWAGVTSKPDSFRAAWKADTLTGDVNLMKVNDSLDVGGGDFTVNADGKVAKVGGILSGIAAGVLIGVPVTTDGISHGDFLSPDYTSDIDGEGVGAGKVIWTLAVKNMAGSYDLTHSTYGTLCTATGNATYSGWFYAGEGTTFSFFFSADGTIAFRAFSMQFTVTP